jgi:hypothetical protein
MSFVWFQQWVALPVIYEGAMGDLPPGSRPQTVESGAAGFARDGNQGFPASSLPPYKSQDNSIPFYSQLSALPQNQFRPDYRSSAHPPTQYQSQEHGASPMNMGSMANALPEFGRVEGAPINPLDSQSIPRSLTDSSTSAVAYQLGQNLQMSAHGAGNMSNHHPYGAAYGAGPYQQQAYGQGSQHAAYTSYSQSRLPTTTMPTAYQNYPGSSQYMYFSTPYGMQGQYNSGYSVQGTQSQVLYERRGSMTGANVGLTTSLNMDYQHQEAGFTGARMSAGGFPGDQGAIGPAFGAPFIRAQGERLIPLLQAGPVASGISTDNASAGMPHSGPVSSIPRGPPRKPKQSGHALWVGNLPPGTTVTALKDHFSREATKDIESLFLISKSNCAFVNYRSEVSCTAAMHRFHDSRFNGVRLVCRLRRSSAPASGVPTGPSAMVGSPQTNVSPPITPKSELESAENQQEDTTETSSHKDHEEERRSSTGSSKYFIVKSLTLQDLELSVRNGIWATQSHNEDVLNKAFRVITMQPHFRLSDADL